MGHAWGQHEGEDASPLVFFLARPAVTEAGYHHEILEHEGGGPTLRLARTRVRR